MVHIEFVGMPGGGKTTLKKMLVRNLKKVDKKKYLTEDEAFLEISKRNIDRIYRTFLMVLPKFISERLIEKLKDRSQMQRRAQNRFLSKWGKSFAVFINSDICQLMRDEDRTTVITGFIHIASIFEAINTNIDRNKAVLFEEGFLQKSLMFRSHKENDLQKIDHILLEYLDNIPLPDIVINVKTDIGESYSRMVGRKTGLTQRLKKANKNEILNFLKNVDAHIEFIIQYIKKNDKIRYIEVDNNKIMDDYLDDLTKRLSEDAA